ncbi:MULTISPECIES: DM13 domain-containing protein [unclassified Blastococcus]
MRRRTWAWLTAALVVAALGAFVLVWFQPQKLFYDDEVSEALPTAAAPSAAEQNAGGGDGGTGGSTATPSAPAQPVDLATGTFVSREHETVGTARVVQLPDGQVIVRLEGFETSNGPALYVYLSQNPAAGTEAAFDDEFVDLGALKGNVGDQNYVVPAGVDATGFTSVVIWCDRFDAAFGAADLAPAAT